MDRSTDWWKVHLATFLGALVMAATAAIAVAGAMSEGGWRAWVVALGFTTNAVALLGIARARHMVRAVEGGDRRPAGLSDLGPWGRLEWWLTLVAFGGFLVGLAALLLG